MPVPPFPAAVPIYPPPNNAPLFQNQRIGSDIGQSTQNDSTSGPVAAEERPNDGSSQKQGGEVTNNIEGSNTVQSTSAQDPPENPNNGNNDDNWGNLGGHNTSGNTGTWANGGANDNGSNNNNQGWGDSGNNTQDDTNHQGWNDENGNTGNGSWQSDTNQDNSGSQQGNSGGGWGNENPNSGGDGNNQPNSESGNQNNNSTPNNVPVLVGNRSNSRALYGPHGAYYTLKSCAQNAPPADAEEEPRYDVPQAIAQSKGVTKQVQPGKGYLYNKKRCVPYYIDSLDEPYARFVFKYRTKEQLKDEIGVEITTEPSPDEDANALENLDKSELIQMVLRAKGALGGTIPSPPPKVTPPSMKSFEQVPVNAPDVGFLRYSLPRMRNVSNTAGLGIRLSDASGNQSNAGNVNQSNNWNGGSNNNWQQGSDQQNSSGNNGASQKWQDNNDQQSKSGWNNQNWSNANNNNNNNGSRNGNSNSNTSWNNISASNKNGWDGQQEKQSSVAASQPSGNFSVRAPSRRSSAISPKGGSRLSGPVSSTQNPNPNQIQSQNQNAGQALAQGDMLDYILNHPEEAAKMGMAGPPPPPPPAIAFTGSGTVAGGQTNIDMDINGAGPRPPTPTDPPPPCSPPSVHDPGAFGPGDWGAGENENSRQPASGW
ncbi:uncharacterized protein A1O5_07664 [Cladophialophora psammophila CBS 110553]|uniref:Uncharacterized protein n=1 Tax=Cladophialophora psammophila CBS 110553 TaxID=1182543 RepID=W9WNZ7_9EURO|nr:uncharacterized protein A1O5_07664 [Cladophialophora psammophila CBS 110553]EXJ69628.1 hypothetical protein A1O5_07664 [Cladophialophora psammophila CBS 110553]